MMKEEGRVMERLLNVGMTVASAAAVTAVLLWMFQEGDTDASSCSSASVSGAPKRARPEKRSIVKPESMKSKERAMKEAEAPLVACGFRKVGSGSDVAQDFIGGLLKLAKACSEQKTGAGFINNFGQPIVILTNPEHVRKLLVKVPSHDLGSLVPASAAFFGKRVLFILEGKEWRELRNQMRHSFLPQNLPLMSGDLTATAMHLVNTLKPFAEKREVLDMHAVTGLYHLAAIGRVAFDYDLGSLQDIEEQHTFVESFEFLLKELPRRAYSQDPSLRDDYESENEDNKKWKMHAKAVRDVVAKFVDIRLQLRCRPGHVKRGDMLDAMIDAFEEETQSKAHSHEVLISALGDNLVEIFFAGYNTTSVTMSVALYYIARNKDLMRKVQGEVDHVLANLKVGEGIDCKKLPLCRAVFHESLRLVPPAPLVYRTIESDLELEQGVVIPGGSSAWVPVLHLHFDRKSWGSDAAVFSPERWLQNDGGFPTGAFVPFSHGPRECLGKAYAELQSVNAIALLLKHFDFSVPADFEFNTIHTGFGLRPQNSRTQEVCLNLKVEERMFSSDQLHDWSPANAKRKGISCGFEEPELEIAT